MSMQSCLRSVALWSVLAAGALPLSSLAQDKFTDPAAAGQALVKAIENSDSAALARVLGPQWKRLLPPGGVAPEDRAAFLAAWHDRNAVVRNGKTAHLEVGTPGWQLPIPLRETAQGWQFDPVAARDEIRTRRIGRNELRTVQSLLAVFDAQREYSSTARDGRTSPVYARRFISQPGRQDGLYWPTPDGAPESPLGPLFAEDLPGDGYHGYRFRMLSAQGPHARGGARSYLLDGQLSRGFAVLAWPVKYGETGVMSFMINHDGQVYERDLGPQTATRAPSISRFDPDPGWKAVDAARP